MTFEAANKGEDGQEATWTRVLAPWVGIDEGRLDDDYGSELSEVRRAAWVRWSFLGLMSPEAVPKNWEEKLLDLFCGYSAGVSNESNGALLNTFESAIRFMAECRAEAMRLEWEAGREAY